MEPQNNPYDFIMNPPKQKKGLKFGGGSQKTRILQMLILVGVLMLVFGGAYLLLQRSGSSETDKLYKLSAQQKDINDLVNQNSSSLRTPKLVNDSATISAVISSQSNEIGSYMSKLNPSKSKKIAAYRDSQYKKALQDATASGTFEDSYSAILANRLDAYRTQIRSIYASTNNKKLKTIMANDYDQLAVFMDQQTGN